MFIFLRFFIFFLYLEIGMLTFIFLMECSRFVVQRYFIANRRQEFYKRRILKELNVMTKDQNKMINLLRLTELMTNSFFIIIIRILINYF